MSRINKSKFAILGLLNKKPRSGYGIKKIFERFRPFYWSESNAQIYPILKSLEIDKMVTSKVDAASGARNKRIYAITKKGIDYLNTWLIQAIEMPKYREELMIKLSMSQHLPKDVLKKHIDDFQSELLLHQKILADNIHHVKTEHTGWPDQENLLLTYDYAKLVLEAKLKWCSDALKNL